MDAGGFLFASTPQGEAAYDAREETSGVCGLIAISQTCDIVRDTGGRNHVAFCPLVRIQSALVTEVEKGRRPYLVYVANSEDTVFADLRRIMSVEKQLVRTWERRSGFSEENARIRFAVALERKFGQFAFPDDFDAAVTRLRQRVWSRHDKQDSAPGKVYRSLEQIRFRAEPNWEADKRKICVIAIMRDVGSLEATRLEISKELEQELKKIEWPDRYQWGSPRLLLGATRDLTAEDLLTSQRGDFEFLCH